MTERMTEQTPLEAIAAAAPTQPEDWQAESAPAQQGDVQINQFEQERGGVAWCDIYGMARDDDNQMHLVKISLTNRDCNAEDALRGLLKALTVAKNEFRLTPYQPTAPLVPAVPNSLKPSVAPVPVAPAVPPAPVYTPVVPPPPAMVAPAPLPSQPSAGGGVFDINKITVISRDDGKMQADLFAPNLKFKVLSVIGNAEKLAEVFGAKGFTAAHFAGPSTYPVTMKVTWKASDKLNANGQPYKNVVSVA
jgi:hypothetical protein